MFQLPLKQIEIIRNIGEKITKLPALSLKEKDFKLLANFVDFNDLTSEEQLNSLLADDTNWIGSDPHAGQIIGYLRSWLSLGNDLLDCVKYFRTLWKDLGKPFGSDDLVPLLIELLPNDKNLLQKILKQLNTALQISNATMYACYLTNLFVAVNTKLSDPKYKADIHILDIAEEIKKFSLIVQLHLLCNERINDIVTLLKQKIPDLVLPDMILEGPKNDEFPDAAFNALKVFDAKEAEINLLREQYKILWDLNTSLNRAKNNATQRLLEFLAKLEHFMMQPITLEKSFVQKVNAIYPFDTNNPLFALIDDESIRRSFFQFFARKEKPKESQPVPAPVNKATNGM